jgi:hypothetical protein
LEVLCLVNAVLKIKWDNLPASAFSGDEDKANFIVYNPAKEAFVTFEDIALRSDKEAVLALPEDFTGDVVHAWMHYVNAEGDAVSTSIYVGNLVVA